MEAHFLLQDKTASLELGGSGVGCFGVEESDSKRLKMSNESSGQSLGRGRGRGRRQVSHCVCRFPCIEMSGNGPDLCRTAPWWRLGFRCIVSHS